MTFPSFFALSRSIKNRFFSGSIIDHDKLHRAVVFVYLCVCLCVWVCICVFCGHVWFRVCVCVSVHVCVSVYACGCVYGFFGGHVWFCVCVCVCVCMCLFMKVCICLRLNISMRGEESRGMPRGDKNQEQKHFLSDFHFILMFLWCPPVLISGGGGAFHKPDTWW